MYLWSNSLPHVDTVQEKIKNLRKNSENSATFLMELFIEQLKEASVQCKNDESGEYPKAMQLRIAGGKNTKQIWKQLGEKFSCTQKEPVS